jgi:hypothetical protein
MPRELGRRDLECPSRRTSGLVGHMHDDPQAAVIIDDDLDMVVADPLAARTFEPAEDSMSAAIGDTAELLVVLVDERSRMAGDIANRRSRDPVGVTEAVEAAADQDAMDCRARSAKQRTKPVGTVSGVGSDGQDLGFGGLGEPAG